LIRACAFIENRDFEEQDGSWMVYYNFDQYLLNRKRVPAKASVFSDGLGLQTGILTPFTSFSA
jgi:hypothetical protein